MNEYELEKKDRAQLAERSKDELINTVVYLRKVLRSVGDDLHKAKMLLRELQ